ncbi:putative 3-methyladenine DNA glycosylase [Phymastichus coffea]|uniref:putative 3-methyladenine DNA glycosylase n=1 Tax=Phymastichus coffea TaxID=108790 RepID=UPI00273C92C5|nr:putative 3-methyladenine DNA glycosylase [Phymastichus coffea]
MKRTRASTRNQNSENKDSNKIDLVKDNKMVSQKNSKKGTSNRVNKNVTKNFNDLKFMEEELQQLEDPPSTPWEIKISTSKLLYSFYNNPCEKLAQNILGKILVRKLDDGTILKGKIVETESYLGIIDKASATYQGKVTPRNIPMYMKPGTIFVYVTYGMYHCFNISSQGEGSSVFLRAVEPLEGIEQMKYHRNSKSNSKVPKKSNKNFKLHELCNGPSKLCIAFDINKDHTKYSMCSWKGMWLEDDPQKQDYKIISCPRIGIDSAGTEWASKPLRYYIFENESVSKRDKKAEEMVNISK